MQRTSIKITGESGSGLVSTGDIFLKALKKKGFYFSADREYPSLIKGGYANYQIDFGLKPIHSLSTTVDVMLAVDRTGLRGYIDTVREGGIVIHGDERHHLVPGLDEKIKAKKLRVAYLPARTIAHKLGGNELVVNMVLLGLVWRILGFKREILEDEVRERFAKKPKLLEIDLKCIDAGYMAEGIEDVPKLDIELPKMVPKKILLDGNAALTLGAIHAGVRAYYAYPMSPSSTILTYMANWAKKTGMLVKQVEDEISVAQMTIGSMFMGTRALAATSGGGFDLMAESLSLPGMIESPFVLIVAQRPGPATGLPTWTMQADLNLVIHSAHGEFPRIVIGVSDLNSCFELIQHAFNLAEKFQSPVIVLTEKVIAETKTLVDPFKQNTIPIERGLVTDKDELAKLEPSDRFKFTENGLSKRWLPGSCETYYYANGDEHKEDGTLEEETPGTGKMYEKRMKKMKLIEEALPEPVVYGPAKADISVVGWGSTKNVMIDAMEVLKEKGIAVNYLHYDYVWPLKLNTLKKFFKENKKIVLLEGNYTGQLGTMISEKAQVKFTDTFLKFDGRPFFLDEVVEFLTNHSQK